MKKKFILSLCICIAINGFITSMQLHAQKLNNDMDSLSYSLGVILATNLQSQGFEELNSENLKQGLTDVMKSNDLKIDVEAANENVQKYMQKKAKKAQGRAVDAEKEFLEQNKKREGVKVTDSGLQYEVLEEGNGETPKATDEVTVHYTGKLLNGKVFDSSVERGEPASFPVNGVIQGWQEALQLMKEGAKYRLYIPYELAYGERGAGQSIPPFSTLIFDVELLEVK